MIYTVAALALSNQRMEKTIMNIAVFASMVEVIYKRLWMGVRIIKLMQRWQLLLVTMEVQWLYKELLAKVSQTITLVPRNQEVKRVWQQRFLDVLSKYNVDMIFLAGYMRMLHISVLERYNNRIFNIHPALLPKFGGKGMFGMNVHTAVIEAKESETGVTIHRVNAEYDSGKIVAQTTVPVLERDTLETLAARVLEREHEFLVEVIADIVNGKIPLGE